MFFAQTADWTDLGRAILGEITAQFATVGLTEAKLALVITVPTNFGAAGFAHRGAAGHYPAGLAAPFHMLHGLAALEAGRFAAHPDVERALREMVLWPSDSAANYVIDCLTGTTGDTALEGAEYLDWAAKRGRLDRFFWQMGWPEWESCRITQKQGSDLRYGREARLVGTYGEGLNSLTALSAARLLWEMFEGDLPVGSETLRRAQFNMQRDPTSPDAVFPNFGLAEFLGGGLPAGLKLWSKPAQTGWTGDAKTAWVKHDMLRIVARGMRPLHIVAMVQGRALSSDAALFPALGRMIWDRAAPLLQLPKPPKTAPPDYD